jgi:hypothetical protein
VFVTKLAAVLNASAAGTPSTFVGSSGSTPWTRCSTNSPITETTLNARSEIAYTFHGCSRRASTPAAR